MAEQTNEESEWDFRWGNDTSNLALEAIPTDLGITYIEDMSEANVKKLQVWAKAQLESILNERYSQVTMRVRRTEPKPPVNDLFIFGAPLAVLIENDRKYYHDPRRDNSVPLVLEAMMIYFTLKGGMSMGSGVIAEFPTASSPDFRRPKNAHCSPKLTQRNVLLTLDRYFYKGLKYSHTALNMAKVQDIVYAIKHFVFSLPEPLLTNQFIDVFLQLNKVKDSMDLLIIMKLLIFQMPKSHRCTLWSLLSFFSQISARDEKDAMIVVREVMGPYFFPVSEAMRAEMPAETIEPLQRQLTLLMHKYRTILFAVPVDVVNALRTHNKKSKSDASKVDVTVNSPQLGIQNFKINGDQGLNASKVIELALSSVMDKHCPKEFQNRINASWLAQTLYCFVQNSTSREQHRKLLAQLTCQWMDASASKCNMRSSDPEFFRDCHRLYETGGNIDERRVSPSAKLAAVVKENGEVQWSIRCDHPVCMSEFARNIPNYEKVCDENVVNQLTCLCRSPAFDT